MAFRAVNVNMRGTRSALGRRKCNSVARATQSRDTADRVACSNGISTRERVRGHAHTSIRRSHAPRSRKGAYDTTKRHSSATAQFTRPSTSSAQGWGCSRKSETFTLPPLKLNSQENWKKKMLLSCEIYHIFVSRSNFNCSILLIIRFYFNKILRYCKIFKWILLLIHTTIN